MDALVKSSQGEYDDDSGPPDRQRSSQPLVVSCDNKSVAENQPVEQEHGTCTQEPDFQEKNARGRNGDVLEE